MIPRDVHIGVSEIDIVVGRTRIEKEECPFRELVIEFSQPLHEEVSSHPALFVGPNSHLIQRPFLYFSGEAAS